MTASGEADRYKALFERQSTNDLKNQFADIVGSSYEALDPTMLSLFQQVDDQVYASGLQLNEAASKICDNSLMASMNIDDIILSCIYNQIESFCGDDESPERFDTFVCVSLRPTPWKPL